MSETEAMAVKKKQIFRKRAKVLADGIRGEAAARARLNVVEFRLAQERYAVESAYVREVLPLKDLTPLPCTPPYVMGLINVRGQILSVIDLRVFFELPRKRENGTMKVVILHSGDMEFGIVANTVEEARSVPLDEILPALPTMTGIRETYLKGIAGGDLVILDAARLLADKNIVVNEHVEGE
ncbi:MAG: chemotaxis protein CheW [Lentisphaerota bacterium]